MINLRNSPFLWFSLLLLISFGIAQSTKLTSSFPVTLILWSVSLISSSLCLLKFSPGRQWISTLAIGFLLFSAGIFRIIHFKSEIFPADPIQGSMRMEGLLSVTEVLKVKENSVSLRCTIIHLTNEVNPDQPAYLDKYILVLIKEFETKPIFPGDIVQTTGWVSPLAPPLNPYAFDMRKYYSTLGIRHQLFCKGNETIIKPATGNSLFRMTAKWQFALSDMVSRNTSPEVAQLTNALVWGDRSDMDEDIRDAFARSGAMHVLSVSGMHMAMIYSLLYLILGAPGSGTFTRRLIRLICYTMAITLYMGLTGACPAVVRSGMMIILFLFGKAMGWNTQIWNLLGFAAFLMLWSNPFLYENIGFQLSFLAMAGILLYAKPIIRSLTFRWTLAHWTWEITAVSMAAQVFILPILLRQFHQFPLTFVASSLVAMPASYIIIFGSMLNMVLSCFGITFLWQWYDKAGFYFIQSMKWLAQLNPEMNYSLPPIGGLLLMAMSISFSFALVFNWKSGKIIAYAFGFAALFSLGWHRLHQWSENDLVIYHHYKGLIADIMVDGQCISIQDSSLTRQSIEFATRGNRCYRDVIHTSSLNKTMEFTTGHWDYTASILHFSTASVLVWNGTETQSGNTTTITHILVDDCQDIKSLKEFLCLHENCTVILPGYLERRQKNRLMKFLEENTIPYYDISQQGYFKLNL